MPYNPNAVWGSRSPQSPEPSESPSTPGEPAAQEPLGSFAPQEQHPPSFFKRHSVAIFAITLIVLVGFAGLVFYLLLPPSAPNIAIAFTNPGAIVIGEPFPLMVTVSNQSKSSIENAQLTVTLPAGLSFVASGTTPSQRALMIPLGTLNSETSEPPEDIQVVATGDAGTAQTVTALLTYGTPATADTQFASNAATSFAIGSQTALSLNYSAPSSIFSGQNFDLAVNYANNTGQTMNGVELVMQYPPAYHYASASGSAPTDPADTTWDLGTLGPNATGTLVITGNIVGPTQAQYQITGSIGASWSGQNYPSFSAPANFAITPSPLSFAVTLNGSSSYIATAGDSLTYTLTYTNNSPVAFQTANITATLTGRMFDLASLQTKGSFDSRNDTITWYAANTPALASIAPGQSGSVSFSIQTLSSYPIRQIANRNYTLAVAAEIQSPTVPPNTQGSSTISVASLSTKVGGEISLAADGYAKETDIRSFGNTGPYPPKVNQPTTYTIHWDITNYSTDMKDVTVSAYLQSGTTFTGLATSTVPSSTFTVNAGTGLVTWTIPLVPATTGVISPAARAVFQVSNTPAVNQVGQPVTLLGQSSLAATDAFTGQSMQSTANAITTQLPNDPSIGGQNGSVVQ